MNSDDASYTVLRRCKALRSSREPLAAALCGPQNTNQVEGNSAEVTRGAPGVRVKVQVDQKICFVMMFFSN